MTTFYLMEHKTILYWSNANNVLARLMKGYEFVLAQDGIFAVSHPAKKGQVYNPVELLRKQRYRDRRKENERRKL